MISTPTTAEIHGLSPTGISAWLKRHPLFAFFVIAFAGTWLVFMPILLSKRGLGLISLPDGALALLFYIATYTGPFLAAFLMTAVLDGKRGIGKLLHRIGQWRVGFKWYLIVLLGYPVVFIMGVIIRLGPSTIPALMTNWPTFISGYLITIVVGFLLPTLGEETGWRGFALPHLQQAYGPLTASLVLGLLHALWHLPAYFVNGMLSTGGFDITLFVANSLGIMAFTFVWTWLFNNTMGSIFFATFVHAVSNGMSLQLLKLFNLSTPDPWFAVQVGTILALGVILLTRGRLSFNSKENASLITVSDDAQVGTVMPVQTQH